MTILTFWHGIILCWPPTQDPTELGTMVGAVVCAGCGAAAVVPSQPLEQAAPWHCRACGHAHAAASIHTMLTGGAAVV